MKRFFEKARIKKLFQKESEGEMEKRESDRK